jgi:hypothetical protein
MSLTYNKKTKKLARIAKDGELLKKMGDNSINTVKSAFSLDNLGGTVAGLASGIGGITNASVANTNVNTVKADNAIEAINAYTPVNTSLSGITNGYNTLNFNNDINAEDMTVTTGEGLANMGRAGLAGFTTGMQAGGIWGGIIGGIAGLGASGGAWAAGSAKAKKEAERLQNEKEIASMSALNKASDARDEYFENKYNNFRTNSVAYGGPIYNHSGDWSNGITFINEGGTHESNPLGGVLMGFDQEGTPNLVEEGEIIYNDYVFSNRLKPSKKQLKSSGLNNKYNNWTFARIVEDLQKNSAETPNDKISMDSLNDMMNIMMSLQEEIRAKKGLKGQNRLMAKGGHIFDGESDFSNWTDYDEGWLDALTQETIDDITSNLNKKHKSNIWGMAGMYAPIVDSIGKTIYNIAKPIDESNIIAEEAYRELPKMELPRLTQHKVPYKSIDRNSLITPIINIDRAVAKDIQNLGTTSADVMNRLALNTYNTQNAIGKAYLDADKQDFINRMQNAQFNLGVDSADAQLLQAEQAANIQIAENIAKARVADAAQREQLEQLKGQAIDTTSAATTQELANLSRQNIEWNLIKNNPIYAEAIATLYDKNDNDKMLTKKRRK